MNSEVDGDLIIPSVELGASLGAEYCGDLAKDESLKEWKSWRMRERMVLCGTREY